MSIGVGLIIKTPRNTLQDSVEVLDELPQNTVSPLPDEVIPDETVCVQEEEEDEISMLSSMDYPTTIPGNSHDFFLYSPKHVTEETPLIVACHGYCDDADEMSGFGEGNFELYAQVYKSYHPEAIILFPTKNYYGEWMPDDIANLTEDFVDYYNLQGNVYYYGFSQGCLNGPDIIEQYGKYKAAVFVDEDFLAYPYPSKDCPPRGMELALTQLSSLSALRVSGCNYVDTAQDRNSFANLLSNHNILYSEEIYPPNTYTHLEVSSVTAKSSIEWLLSIE